MRKPISAYLQVSPLATTHDRAEFTCGNASLDLYLKQQAGQDLRRKANAVFNLHGVEHPAEILGYVTLCATALAPGDVPDDARKNLPRYPLVSATLIGRLAIYSSQQGRGLGAMLLFWTLRTAWHNAGTIGSSMVVIDAIDEPAAAFYAAHGFIRLPSTQRLILPMHTIGRTIPPP